MSSLLVALSLMLTPQWEPDPEPRVIAFFRPGSPVSVSADCRVSAEFNVYVPGGFHGYLPGSEFGLPLVIQPEGTEIPVVIDYPLSDWEFSGDGYEILSVEQPEFVKEKNDLVVRGLARYRLDLAIESEARRLPFQFRYQLCDESNGTCRAPITLQRQLLIRGAEACA